MEGDHENSNIAYLLNKELTHIWGYVSSLSDAITWKKKKKKAMENLVIETWSQRENSSPFKICQLVLRGR